MKNDEFSVYQFFDEYHERVAEGLPANEAVALARRLAESVAARIGLTRRLIVIDRGFRVVLEWKFDAAATFPPRPSPEPPR